MPRREVTGAARATWRSCRHGAVLAALCLAVCPTGTLTHLPVVAAFTAPLYPGRAPITPVLGMRPSLISAEPRTRIVGVSKQRRSARLRLVPGQEASATQESAVSGPQAGWGTAGWQEEGAVTAGAETIVATSEAAQLTERVRRTVGMIQRRQQVFQKYAEDISGKTGLGAIAALAYVNRVIERREPVWGDLLMIVMRRKPVQVEQTLLDATRQVLAAPIDAAEWVWFRDNLLSTFVWFAPSPSASDPDRSGTGFVYDSLLAIAREELALQARVADALQFPELHGIASRVLLPGGHAECRQDHRLVGNAAGIKPQLLQTSANREFYDLNVYLNQLRCIANLVDPSFQRVLRAPFAPLGAGAVFEPGPAKSSARCRAKAQADYAGCEWPTTAHLLDMVRCSVTFESAALLLEGLERLYSAAGRVGTAGGGSFEVARVKNGFAAGKGGYRDIKVNVVFLSDQGFAMIGEVALCLAPLVEYKERTHELYEILREETFFREVTAILGEGGSMQFGRGQGGDR